MSEDWKTIATFYSPTEASIAVGRLESAGIEVVQDNAAIVGMSWRTGDAIGGVRLRVSKLQVEQAEAILADHASPIEGNVDWSQADRPDPAAAEVEEIPEPPAPPPSRGDLLSRAHVAALLGCVLFPALAYAVLLLLGLPRSPEPWTAGERRSLFAALGICMLGLVCQVALFRTLARP